MRERKRINIFCCYADEDRSLFLELQAHLKVLAREGYITLWSDIDIRAGNERKTEIERYLNETQLILLLVSPAFMASDRCYNIEMRQAMDRHKLGKARVIPIILRPIDWEAAPFGKLQALPTGAEPITRWGDNRDEAFCNVVKGVREALKQRHNLPLLHECVGREEDVEQVLAGLMSSGPPVALVGEAGVGKTTLALKVAYSCLPEPEVRLAFPFDNVVWVSAKDRPEQKLWLNEIIDTIAEVLGIGQLPAMRIERKKQEINRLLSEHRTLVVLDNFETMEDPDLNVWMEGIPKRSRILVSSRPTQLQNLWLIEVLSLREMWALKLICKHLELQPNDHVQALRPLINVMQGNPLAIKLALRRVQALGLVRVVDDLQAVRGSMDDVFNQLFSWSWEAIREEAKNLLMVASFFADNMEREALGDASGLTSGSLDAAMMELVGHMLLDNRDPITSTPRYSIHPLTREFASSQLEKRRAFEKQARMRWCEYYLALAARSLTRDGFAERYWNALQTHKHKLIDPEWSNLQKVLAWADQQGQDQILVELMLLLAHYMCARMLFSERIYYSQKAAEAAIRLGRKADAALLRIDGSGWILLEEGRLTHAREEITIGSRIAHTLDASSTDRTDLLALANTWLAATLLKEGDRAEASALMDKVTPVECKPIQYRVHLVAGNIAYEEENIAKARELYESAYEISLQYGGEGVGVGVHAHLGNVYLAMGDLVQAEAYFDKVLAMGQDSAPERIPHAKYGRARLALKKGQSDKARQLALEAWSDLSHAVTAHRLLSEIRNFLESLEDIS